jgi:hypothetical protein
VNLRSVEVRLESSDRFHRVDSYKEDDKDDDDDNVPTSYLPSFLSMAVDEVMAVVLSIAAVARAQ